MLIVPEHNLAIANRCLITRATLDETRCAIGEVVNDMGLPLFNRIYIDYVDIGAFTNCQCASIV